MPDVTAGYGKLSDFNVVFGRIFKEYYIIVTLHLPETFTNYVFRQKCTDEFCYVGLVF